MKTPKKLEAEARKLPDGVEKENKLKGAVFMRKMIETNSPRFMTMASGKSIPYNMAQAFVELTNGHILKGIGLLLKKIDVPVLPKDEP